MFFVDPVVFVNVTKRTDWAHIGTRLTYGQPNRVRCARASVGLAFLVAAAATGHRHGHVMA